MTALDWLRRKATVYSTDTLECDGRTVRVTRYAFQGRIPPRMVYELRKATLRNDFAGKDAYEGEMETLRTGGQYRSDFGKCEYLRSVYEQVT